MLHRFVLPDEPDDAQRVVVGIGAEETRVYLHPVTGQVLKTIGEEDRVMRVIFRLHGELMAGRWGSTVVELAASWTIMMLLTGLFLWWPRGAKNLGGVLYPRLGARARMFWKDIHAVTGIWVSLLAIVLIFSGLPWANNWGDYLAAVRSTTGQVEGPVDWSRGSETDAAERVALDQRSRAALGQHAEHSGMGTQSVRASSADMNRVVVSADRLGLAAPVEITPPAPGSAIWKVQSNSANRPERSTVEIDGQSGDRPPGVLWHRGARGRIVRPREPTGRPRYVAGARHAGNLEHSALVAAPTQGTAWRAGAKRKHQAQLGAGCRSNRPRDPRSLVRHQPGRDDSDRTPAAETLSPNPDVSRVKNARYQLS